MFNEASKVQFTDSMIRTVLIKKNLLFFCSNEHFSRFPFRYFTKSRLICRMFVIISSIKANTVNRSNREGKPKGNRIKFFDADAGIMLFFFGTDRAYATI